MPTSAPREFPFTFLSREPAGDLGRAVAAIWYARGTVPYTREKIAPTGSTVAVFVLGDPISQTPRNGAGETYRATEGFIVGPHRGPVINEPHGETHAVGIVGTPVGCRAVFGCGPGQLHGRVLELSTVWSAATELRRTLAGSHDPEEMLDVVEQTLLDGLDLTDPGLDRCTQAVALIESNPRQSIADVAGQLGLSHGHLDAEFTRIVGLTPRALSTLLRIRALLLNIDRDGDVHWGALAAEHGWFDQAHLIRDFKRHTGVTPTEYLRAQRSVSSPVGSDDTAGFIPED